VVPLCKLPFPLSLLLIFILLSGTHSLGHFQLFGVRLFVTDFRTSHQTLFSLSMTSQNAQGQADVGGEDSQRDTSLSLEIMEKCIGITERFCAGMILKVSALLELQATVLQDNESTYHQALGAYIRVLNNFERIKERANPEDIPGGGGGNETPDAGRDDGEEGDDAAEQNKRTWSESPGADDGTTKRKIDISSFAWVIHDGIDPLPLSPSLLQTQAILKNFS
jgi:hypothetical protein